jgi:NADH dehydrogenase FAD-containing subunit
MGFYKVCAHLTFNNNYLFTHYTLRGFQSKKQFYRFDTSGDLTYDLLVYATGSEQANHYTTEAVKEKF